MTATETATWSEVARVATPAGAVFVELPAAHLEAVTVQAMELLGSLGVVPGDRVAVIGDGSDIPSLWPVAAACVRMNAPHMAADIGRFARPNLVAFFERFTFRALLGLTAPVSAAITEHSMSVAEVFRDATVMATDTAIADSAESAGWRRWVTLGPLIAHGCPGGDGLHVLTGHFSIDADGGALTVHGPGSEVVTGMRGRPEGGPCPCGLGTPRWIVEGGHQR